MTAAAFEVLSLPTLAVDRRALSQAWYDALHVARRQSSCATREPVGAPAAHSRRFRATVCAGPTGPSATSLGAASRRATAVGARTASAAAVLSPRDVRRANRVGQSIAAAVQRNASRASFTLARGRVHVVVEHRGGSLRLIALCPPSARAFVERALASARFALACSGIAVAW